jgi:hypothetical protein
VAAPDIPVTAPEVPEGRRTGFLLLLFLLFALLILATVLASWNLDPLMRIPPNRYVEWTKAMNAAGYVTGLFGMLWWAVAILLGGLALLTWKGSLDRLLLPFLAGAFLACLATGSLSWYVWSLPDQVEKSHGLEIHHRIFGPYREK